MNSSPHGVRAEIEDKDFHPCFSRRIDRHADVTGGLSLTGLSAMYHAIVEHHRDPRIDPSGCGIVARVSL